MKLRRLCARILIVFMIVTSVFSHSKIYVMAGQNDISIKVLNVPGDATLVTYYNEIRNRQENILIDCGTDGDRLLSELRNSGVRSLEGVIMTHNHKDHVSGVEKLSNAISVERVYYSNIFYSGSSSDYNTSTNNNFTQGMSGNYYCKDMTLISFNNFVNITKDLKRADGSGTLAYMYSPSGNGIYERSVKEILKNSSNSNLSRNIKIELLLPSNYIALESLNMSTDQTKVCRAVNNSSMMVKITNCSSGKKILFGGDTFRQSMFDWMRWALKSGNGTIFEADLYKISHHGRRTDSSKSDFDNHEAANKNTVSKYIDSKYTYTDFNNNILVTNGAQKSVEKSFIKYFVGGYNGKAFAKPTFCITGVDSATISDPYKTYTIKLEQYIKLYFGIGYLGFYNM